MLNYDYFYNIFMTCIICYLPAIYIFKRYIDSLDINTKIWLSEKLKISWSIWCFSLSLFSLFGTLYTGKYIFIDRMTPKIFETEYELWYNLFIVSKIPELRFLFPRESQFLLPGHDHEAEPEGSGKNT